MKTVHDVKFLAPKSTMASHKTRSFQISSCTLCQLGCRVSHLNGLLNNVDLYQDGGTSNLYKNQEIFQFLLCPHNYSPQFLLDIFHVLEHGQLFAIFTYKESPKRGKKVQFMFKFKCSSHDCIYVDTVYLKFCFCHFSF